MSAPRRSAEESIYRIPPYYYLHVLDQNLNVTRLEIGPQTYIRQDNERCNIITMDLHINNIRFKLKNNES